MYVHARQNWVLEISVLEWRLGVGAWQAFEVTGNILLVTKSANYTITIVPCVTANLNKPTFIFFLDISFNRLFQHPTKAVLQGVTNIKPQLSRFIKIEVSFTECK